MVTPGEFGGTLPDLMASILRADGRGDFRFVPLKIFQAVQAADLAQRRDDILGNLSEVEAVASLCRDGPQGAGKRGLADNGARRRRFAIDKKIAGGVHAFAQLFAVARPVPRGARTDHKPIFGGADGRLQRCVEPLAAVPLQQRSPEVDRAGNGDRVRPGERDRLEAALQIPLGAGLDRRRAGAVIGEDVVRSRCRARTHRRRCRSIAVRRRRAVPPR